MQKPIRYYLTTSGDEPTVRSVKVTLGAPDPEETVEVTVNPSAAPAKPRRSLKRQTTGVKRIVKDAIRRRP